MAPNLAPDFECLPAACDRIARQQRVKTGNGHQTLTKKLEFILRAGRSFALQLPFLGLITLNARDSPFSSTLEVATIRSVGSIERLNGGVYLGLPK
jgi:hypothetical protein